MGRKNKAMSPVNEFKIKKIKDAFIVVNRNWVVVSANSECLSMLNKTNDELIGKNIQQLYPEIYETKLFKELSNALKKKAPVHVEFETVKRNYFEVHAFPTTEGLSIYFRNITLRNKKDEENAELASIVKSSSYPVVTFDREGIISGWNKAAEKLYGYKSKEVLGKSIAILIPEEVKFEYHHIFRDLGKKKRIDFETIRRRKNGKYVDVFISMFPVRDSEGNIIKYSAIVRDITTEKRLKNALLKERKRLYSILDEFPGYVCVSAPNYKIKFANKNFVKTFGNYKNNKPCYQITKNRTAPCENCHTYSDYLPSRPSRYEINTIDGRYLEMYEQPFADVDGSPLVIKIAHDITERKCSEEELMRLEMLNVLGETAAGIAHEIRNPMTTVRGFIQLLSGKEEFFEYKDYYDIMISEIDRANSIITEFLALAKNKHVDFSMGNLKDIISSVAPLFQVDAIGKDKSIILELKDVKETYINEKQIRQLIINLVRNGLEAMKSGKNLRIGTFMEGDEVVIFVEDEGHGIDKNMLSKLGTPFLTTKENGTGLGLAICYSIASRHGATIDVKTSSKGTRFTIKFK